MDYGKILRDSWQIVKTNKVLWVLGMLLGGIGFGINGNSINWQINDSELETFSSLPENVHPALEKLVIITNQFIFSLRDIPVVVWVCLVIVFIFSMLLLGIVRVYIRNWAEASVIGAVNEVDTTPITFKTASSYGIKYVLRLLFISIIPGFLFSMVCVSLFVAVAFLFVIPIVGPFLAIILGGLLLFLIAFGAIVLNMLQIMAFRIVVIDNKKALEGYKASFQLLRKEFIPIVAQSLINYSIGCVFGCLYLAIIFLLLGLVVGGFLLTPFVGIPLLVPVILVLVLSTVALGILNAFKSTTWTLLYKELRQKGVIDEK